MVPKPSSLSGFDLCSVSCLFGCWLFVFFLLLRFFSLFFVLFVVVGVVFGVVVVVLFLLSIAWASVYSFSFTVLPR